MSDGKRVQCVACGNIHCDVICPNCKCVVCVDVKDKRQ